MEDLFVDMGRLVIMELEPTVQPALTICQMEERNAIPVLVASTVWLKLSILIISSVKKESTVLKAPNMTSTPESNPFSVLTDLYVPQEAMSLLYVQPVKYPI